MPLGGDFSSKSYGGGDFGRGPSGATIPPELQSMAGELGIDLGALSKTYQAPKPFTFKWDMATTPAKGGLYNGITSDDESTALRSAMEQFAKLAKSNPAAYRRTQEELLRRGFFDQSFYSGKRKVAPGLFDIDTAQAFSRAVGQALLSGDLDDVLFGALTPEQMEAMSQYESANMAPVINPFDVENQAESLRRMYSDYGFTMPEDELKRRAFGIVQGQHLQPGDQTTEEG